ncbi:MAG: DNA polymerase III subunit delta [Planctomycetota bacterium]
MAKPVPGLAFLLDTAAQAPGSFVVLSGDEGYLKREALRGLRRHVCGDDQGDLAWSAFLGKEAEWRDVHDALTAVSLFGGGVQAAVVEEADTFVTHHRPQLEDYAAKPPAGALLVLDVKTWPANTRLAKAVDKIGLTLRCQAPDRGAELGQYKRHVKQWLARRASATHQAELRPAAADVLLDLLPLSLGLLDQEVARLALLAGGGAIDSELVREHVGGWRTRKTWDMIDAMADGDAADALQQLDRLLLAGEQPIGLLAQASSTLRRFAAAACLFAQAESAGERPSLRRALEQAGVVKFKLADAERQLKQIGRDRAAELDRRLLAADLAMKGHNSSPTRSRIELERLIVWLSRQADPRRSV